MNIGYKVVETKVEGDWGHQLIEMPYEVLQMILKEMDEPDSDHEVGNAVVWNREIPDGFAWETFDFVDPNNPHGKLLAGWDVPKLASRDVVTMVLTIYNETAV